MHAHQQNEHLPNARAKPRVLVVLPAPMIARNWLSTPVIDLMARRCDVEFLVVTSEASDRQFVEAKGLRWRAMLRGGRTRGTTRLRYYAGYLLHQMLMHRFNAIAEFRGARERLKQSWSLRKIAIRDGLPASRWFGWPFPRSRTLFCLLQQLYYSGFQRYSEVEELFANTNPQLVVIGHVQNHFTTPYALAALKRGVRILGAVGSWDQPTTKGPLNPGITSFMAQSKRVADELVQYHGVVREKIEVIGWTQMDLYGRRDFDVGRQELLAQLGLPPHWRYVLMAAYPERLGQHEPELCGRLAEHLVTHRDCGLVVRCHPNDRTWQSRFGFCHRPPYSIVLPPEIDRLDRMANQVQHAEVVLSSAGTILLDAVALDTPAVGIAFEDQNDAYYDRVARRYDMEHWAALVASGGLPLASRDDELFSLIDGALANRNLHAAGRVRLRSEQLDPIDGQSSERLLAAVLRSASAAADYASEFFE